MRLTDVFTILLRGLRKRCPQCGRGRLYATWYSLERSCTRCNLSIEVEDGNTWAFMYFSTAFLTGIVFVGMFIFRPDMHWRGRTVVLLAALALIVGTLPVRKAIAIAINYVITLRWDNHDNLRLRREDESGRDGA